MTIQVSTLCDRDKRKLKRAIIKSQNTIYENKGKLSLKAHIFI